MHSARSSIGGRSDEAQNATRQNFFLSATLDSHLDHILSQNIPIITKSTKMTTATSGITTPPRSVEDAREKLINTRVKVIRPLIPPQILQEDYPLYVQAPLKQWNSRPLTRKI